MQPPINSANKRGSRVIALCLIVVVVGSVFAGAAGAVPAIGIRNADLSETTAVPGERVTVTAEAVNVGDSRGGYTFEFERNGTAFAEQRVTVPANENRTVNRTVRFDAPGAYRITVDGKFAGVVRVQPARTRVVSENDDRRRIDVRASGVSASSPTTFDVPATNRSLALQQWSTVTGQSAFQQDLTEYSTPSDAPGTLPPAEQSTLVGLLTVDTVDEFQEGTMRLAVNESVIANSPLGADEVAVYQRNDSAWERLETSVVDERDDRVVYEATATRESAYAVGHLDSDISVTSTAIRSSSTAGGQRLSLDAVLTNTGPVAGEYVAAMFVNGEQVNRSTVTVPATGERAVSLSYDVSDAGTYSLALNGTTAGQVIISESQLAEEPSEGAPSTAAPGQGTATPGDGGVAGPPSVPGFLPPTVLGINTLYLGGGLAIALGAFIAILVLLRRSDSGGGGGSDGFDQF